MPHIVTETAQLRCDKGAAPASLKVTSQHYSCYDDKPIATEQDKAPEANIPSFGTCMITRSRCTPAPLAWDSPAEKEEIDGMRVLLLCSTCKCAVGGTISIADKGHSCDADIQ
ncbi:DUF4280 domain-containing protein [Chitinophaga vietnamensis]|uniref:DUF4280 domain-containing protein n=1 Tax=Chitinophaga vietnamensis TaxID=2593957 RepID=UPI0011779648|nr:DUF4280 domain-containing protein [Chitinophaga vietnamensis]